MKTLHIVLLGAAALYLYRTSRTAPKGADAAASPSGKVAEGAVDAPPPSTSPSAGCGCEGKCGDCGSSEKPANTGIVPARNTGIVPSGLDAYAYTHGIVPPAYNFPDPADLGLEDTGSDAVSAPADVAFRYPYTWAGLRGGSA